MSQEADPGAAVEAATAVVRASAATQSSEACDAAAAPDGDARSERRALVLLLSCFTLWCAWFVYRSSFLVAGQRVFCLFDDAMISMVYARDWVEGYGLNWARHGAPVEGYTHPLWMFYMAGLHLLPLPIELQSLAVQITSWATLVLNVLVVKRLVQRHFAARRVALSLPAAVLTASYYPLNQWALQGMESGLEALLISLAVLLSLEIGRDKRRETALMFVLTVSVLLRMDMAVLVAIVLGMLIYERRLSAQNLRRWVPGFMLFATANLGYMAFRLVYFHDWLPNTYYLKMWGTPAEVRVLRGAIVFLEWLDITAIPLLIVSVAMTPFLKRNSPFVPPTLVVASFFAYSIYVGGDVWEAYQLGANRFQVVVMPLVFVLLNGLLNRGIERLEHVGIRLFRGYITLPVTLAFALLCNGLWLCKDTTSHWRNILVASRPLFSDTNAIAVQEALVLQQHLDPRALVAVTTAGTPAYFTNFRLLDQLGYNDRHIARLNSIGLDVNSASAFLPGHMKWDLNYTFGVMKPDVVWQLWGISAEDLANRYGYVAKLGVYVRRNSPYFHD